MKTIYITEEGRINLEKKIKDQLKIIDNLRKEKEIAYESSGDGWHDNPGFNNLMRDEERAVSELFELQSRLAGARVITPEYDSVPDTVCIGTIVTYEMKNLVTGKVRTQKMMIAGSGETDTARSRISYDSPVGAALTGMKAGEEKEIAIPAGRCLIRVIRIEL